MIEYNDENGDPQTEEIDNGVAVFGESVYGVVRVEPLWTNVYIYFERLGTYSGIMRGSIKFLNPLPSEVIPNLGESIDGVPMIMEILLNGVAGNTVSVTSGSSLTISVKFNGTAEINGADYNGLLSYATPVVILPTATGTYDISVTKSGRTVTETITVTVT